MITFVVFLIVALSMNSYQKFIVLPMEKLSKDASSMSYETLQVTSKLNPADTLRIISSKWSPQALIEANVTSVLLVPEANWSTSIPEDMEYDVSCPVHFFVYSNLPDNLTSTLENKVLESIDKGFSHENANLDLALVKLFRTSPCRTTDPAQAALFVVPYLHCAHCIFGGYTYRHGCQHVPDHLIHSLYQSLDYFNDTTLQRKHVFLASWGTGMTKTRIERSSIVLSTGPSTKYRDDNIPSGSIVLPLMNDRPEFQPSVLRSHGTEWWTRPRTFSFTYIYGAQNRRMRGGGRFLRAYFENDLRTLENNKTLGGLPFLTVEITKTKKAFNAQDAFKAYRDSIFCPVLSGDLCWQKRFYDVVLSGCLPVVLEWTTDLPEGQQRSWFLPENLIRNQSPYYDFTIESCFPFIKDHLANGTKIAYDEFVVRAPANSSNPEDVSSIRATMEMLINNPDQLKQMQLSLMNAAQRLAYGLGIESHQSNDAFAHILRVLGHLVAHINTTI